MSQVVALRASQAQQQAATAYNPKKGWSTAAQPEKNLTAADYHTLAHAAAPDLHRQAIEFCERHGLSYVHVSHEDFKNGYEKAEGLSFREWFEDHCEQQGLNKKFYSGVDICIVGPCIKTLASAERKTGMNVPTPDRNVDYLRTMLVAVKKTGSYRNRESLNTLAQAMEAIEKDQETIAIKNYYYAPHAKTGFRGHKSLWVSTAPEDSGLGGMQVLSEVKIEHESQMDLDKLTRRFIDIDRSWQNALQGSFWHTVCGTRAASPKGMDHATDIITGWGRKLYDRMFADAGLNRFLAPALQKTYAPEEWAHIVDHINSSGKEIQANRYKDLIHAVCESGILTSKLVPRPIRQAAASVLCPSR